MPQNDVLESMYGSQYEASFGTDSGIDDPKEPCRVLDWLEKLRPGTFVDYGCGGGDLLTEAAKRNWNVVGVEFDEELACSTSRRTGLSVVTRLDQHLTRPLADVLHLGDVIEHLTEVNVQIPDILSLIKPGGSFVAQGPLENNTSLFTFVLQNVKQLMPSRPAQMAPYHVMLATLGGQRALFKRFGLEEIECHVHEAFWPAPRRIEFRDLAKPRSVGLFLLRRISRFVSKARPNGWGNRYFYVGKWKGSGTP
jgi:SAM-dependent methyltransferase